MTATKLIADTAGLRGFDANQHIDGHAAALFRTQGYRFALRYVPRDTANPADISVSEMQGILSAGLALMLVQHVNRPGWKADAALGIKYGAFAAKSAQQIGYRMGAMLWCDLEGTISKGEDVIKYCNYWHAAVGKSGYTPGLYVGYQCGLSAQQLYLRLRFEHYWSAYNLNSDQYPAVRGVQMKQALQQRMGGILFDPDVVQSDAKGGLPIMMADLEWSR